MDCIARSLPAVPAYALEGVLGQLDQLLERNPEAFRVIAARHLRDAAARMTLPSNRAERILAAAADLESGRPMARPEAPIELEPPAPPPVAVTVSDALPTVPPTPLPQISVWDLFPGLTIRIVRAFVDFDGDEISEGEVLHVTSRDYFPYDGGHTLHFEEKVIRLAEIEPSNGPVLDNGANAFFEPVLDLPAILRGLDEIDERWAWLNEAQSNWAAPLWEDLQMVRTWLNGGRIGSPPRTTQDTIVSRLRKTPKLDGLGVRVALVFAGLERI
ncbi:MAG: hypothetical protein ABI823_21840 [Bryobacteraceae bacterium]